MTTYEGITLPADWLCSSCKRPRAAHTCLGGFSREKHEFVAMLRIKNEERWIAEVIESIMPLCSKIFVMDDHSTDGTVGVCTRYPSVSVLASPFDGLNEARDKNWLYDQIIRVCEPEWILCIDGDEVLEANGPTLIRDTISFEEKEVNSYKLQIAFMWDYRDKVRVDRIYGDFWRPSLFRPFIPDPSKPDDEKVARELRFMATPFGRHTGSDQPNLHCSSVPQRFIHGAKFLPARLKHYGYLHRIDRVRKLDYYTSIDWKNAAEDCYRHMTQGDTPRIDELPKIHKLLAEGVLTKWDVDALLDTPPDAHLVHAGPLRVVDWDETKPWTMSEWARSQNK